MKNILACIIAFAYSLLVGCQKKYADYSINSGFDRSECDCGTLVNLEVLGRVWGYVKYHHPAFASDRFDLDYELFELLPQVADANPTERNRILVAWIEGFGAFKTVPEKCDGILASDSLSDYRTDVSWILDTVELGAELSDLLVQLRHADRRKNLYVSSSEMWLNGVKHRVGNACFNNEKPYAELADPDYGYRLLSVFRFWNMVEYFFPTKYLTNNDWNEVLPEYIARMVQPIDGDYRKEAWRMISEINDNHAQWNRVELFGKWRAPLNIAFVEGRLIVISPDTVPIYYDRQKTFEVGDEIIAVDRRPVDYYLSQAREFVPCSNYNDILAATADIILRSKINRQCHVSYLRNGVRIDTLLSGLIRMEGRFEDMYLFQNIDAYKMLDDSIGYIYPAKYSSEYREKIAEVILKTKALIVDLRCYPSKNFYEFVEQHIISDSITMPQCKYTFPDLDMPGKFYKKNIIRGGCKSSKYQHNIVLLVDERTQSYAETMVQWMQCNTSARTLGSQSAGADGPVSKFTLPCGVSCCFTGLGWFYPDGWCVQRQGVKIDCEVRPSIAGIFAGRDEVLEAAVEILRTKKRTPKI